MDNLWLDVGKILQEKMINTGTNIRLVSCDGIQINNVMNNSPSLNQNVDEHQGIDEFSEIWYLPYSLHFFSTHLSLYSGLNMNINTLLKKYNDGIIKATTGYDVHLSKIAVIFYNTFYAGIWNDHTDFNSILVYSLCFQLPINPLRNGDLLEYAYRNRIGDVFLDINNVIYMKTGEIENTDCKVQ
ncbi:14764_t:CDS:2 [Entrophospora sp. SA101]|nr:14764_t:CDS:2 [Entrophospora sp. SA101]